MKIPHSIALLLAVSVSSSQAIATTPVAPTTVSPPLEDGNSARALKLRSQGNQSMMEMRYVDALAAYEQALALDPDYVGVLYSIARAHQLLGEFPEALLALEQFDQRAPPEVKARVGLLDQLFVELRARVGTLQLTSNVRGARVLVRDKVVGTTPLAPVRLAAGSATVELELDGFFRQRREIVIPAAGALALELRLQSRARSSLLIARTTPAGALVAVDGRPEGTSTPSIELVLPPGSHRVTASRDGYDRASVPVVLSAGAVRTLDIPLEKSVALTSRWWFWTGVGLAVAGGVAVTIALSTERPAENGTLMPGKITGPLRF